LMFSLFNSTPLEDWFIESNSVEDTGSQAK